MATIKNHVFALLPNESIVDEKDRNFLYSIIKSKIFSNKIFTLVNITRKFNYYDVIVKVDQNNHKDLLQKYENNDIQKIYPIDNYDNYEVFELVKFYFISVSCHFGLLFKKKSKGKYIYLIML